MCQSVLWAQQAKHFPQPCEVGAAGGWGLCGVVVASPEGTGFLRDLLTSSAPPCLPDVIKPLRLAMQLEEQASNK